MKTKSLALAALLALASTSASASDEGKFYVGAQLGMSKISSGVLTKTTDTTVGALAGYRINDNLAAEVNYDNMGNATAVGNTTIAFTSYALSAIGSMPVAVQDGKTISAIGKLGYAKNSLKTAGATTGNSAAIFGLGVQYEYSPQLSFRALMDTTKFGSPNTISGANYSVSVLYGF